MPNLKQRFSQCARKLAAKSLELGGTFTEDDAAAYIETMTGLITDKETGTILVDEALRLVQSLKNLPEATGRERIYLNSLRRKLIDEQKLQTKILPRLVDLLESGIPKEDTLITWLSGRVTWKDGKEVFSGVQDSVFGRVEAHKTLQKAQYNQIIQKNNLDALPPEQFDEFMKDLFNLSRDPNAVPSSPYGSAARELLNVADIDRGLFNKNGADLQNNHGLLFSSPLDSVRLVGEEGRTKFYQFWSRENIREDQILALSASLEQTPMYGAAKARIIETRQPQIDAVKRKIRSLAASKKTEENLRLLDAQRRKLAALKQLTPDELFEVVRESVYKKLSGTHDILDVLPEGTGQVRNPGHTVGLKNIVKDVDAQHLFPFKDYETYKGLMAEFGRDGVPSITTLENHLVRNSRLAETANQLISSPRDLLDNSKSLASFFMKSQNTGSPTLDKLSFKDRELLWKSMLDLNRLVELKVPKPVVMYRGQELNVKLLPDGTLDPESLPRRDPTAPKGTPGYERISVDEVSTPVITFLEAKNIFQNTMAWVAFAGGTETPQLLPKPDFILRELTGEAFYAETPSVLARTAKQTNTFVNIALLVTNALTQLTDSVVVAGKSATLREGGLSESNIRNSIRQIWQLFGTGSRVLGYTFGDYLNGRAADLKLAKRPTVEQLAEVDRIGFLIESFNNNYIYDLMDQNLARLSPTEQMDWLTRNLNWGAANLAERGGINSMMRATRQVITEEIGLHAELARQGKLTEGQITRLKAYNITPDELAKAAARDVKGQPVFDPSQIEDQAIRTKVTNFALEEMKLATGSLDDRLRGFRTLGVNPNTPPVALALLTTNLMSFQMNFNTRVLPSIVNETGLPGMLVTLGAMTALQLMVINTKRILHGDTIPYTADLNDEENRDRLAVDIIRAMPLAAQFPLIPTKDFTVELTRTVAEGKSFNPRNAFGGLSVAAESAQDFAGWSGNILAASYQSTMGLATGNEEAAVHAEDLAKKAIRDTNVSWIYPTVATLMGNNAFTNSVYWLFSQTLTGSIGYNLSEGVKENLDPQGIAERRRRRYNTTGVGRISETGSLFSELGGGGI